VTDVLALLHKLSNIVRRQPHLVVEIDVGFGDNMTRTEFQEHGMLAAAAYKRIWREIEVEFKALRSLLLADERGFFQMRYITTREVLNGLEPPEDTEEDTVVLKMEFKFMRSLDLIRLVESDPVTDEDTLISSRQYAIEGNQIEE
jgi:hypothetical protein